MPSYGILKLNRLINKFYIPYHMKIINYIKQNTLAFWISLFYVALGGVVAAKNTDGSKLTKADAG